MPYYRGDYYRGDYYRGDPFLGALLPLAGGVIKKGVQAAGKFFSGGGAQTAAREAAKIGAGAGGAVLINKFTGSEEMSFPLPGGVKVPISTGGGRKSRGGIAQMLGMRKKYRRMNPLNPKALKRALRRAEGFEKFARQTVSGLRYGPKKFKTTHKRK